MGLLDVLRGKLVVALIAGFTLVGGGAAVLAATPAGQQTLHAITGSAHPTATPQATDHSNQNQHPSCVGLADAQHMAAQFSLSSASDSDALQAICALHAGTFKGTTPGGSAISSSRIFGYGEIEQLLTYAKYLANQGGKLTTQNARSYLAAALQSCRTTPLEPCLKAHIPGYHPGNDTGNGNGNGKPESTPTPHH